MRPECTQPFSGLCNPMNSCSVFKPRGQHVAMGHSAGLVGVACAAAAPLLHGAGRLQAQVTDTKGGQVILAVYQC